MNAEHHSHLERLTTLISEREMSRPRKRALPGEGARTILMTPQEVQGTTGNRGS